jgi:predicted AlkP superfamily pyrophosphatase or phosphodiesterase
MARVVVIMLDGLRHDFVDAIRTPCLAAFAQRAECFSSHRSVFPSTTRVVSAAFATGCQPGQNELQGNSFALMEAGSLVLHDAGHPDFLQHKRRVTGRALAVPTLAERLAGHGGVVVFNNVSPGAAYAHDPDGHGYVYHRAGGFGPGRVPLPEAEQLRITLGGEGDAVMARRFIEAVCRGRAALSVLWLSEPDTTQHAAPLGSPQHLETLKGADALAGAVIDAVQSRVEDGEDILTVVGSDHGHQTVADVIDIDAALIEAGLKRGEGSSDVVVAANGTAALIHVDPDCADRIGAIERFLCDQDWVGHVFAKEELAGIGQRAAHGLAVAISMAASPDNNDFGVPGLSFAVKPAGGKPDRHGCGQHGGLGTFEQSPLLLIAGCGFRPGSVRTDPTSIVDIAPTILSHLGLTSEGMNGRALQVPSSQPVESLP